MTDVTGTDAVGEPEAAGVAVEPATDVAIEEVAPDPHALDERHAVLLAARRERARRRGARHRQGLRHADRARAAHRAGVAPPRSPATVLDCDYLSFVAGVDWMPAPKEGGDDAGSDTSSPVQPTETTYGVAGSDGRFQVFAHVQSTSRKYGITFKADVDEDGVARAVVGAGVPRRRLARARDVGDVRLRVRRPPGAAPPLPAERLRGSPAAQGLPPAVARREAVARIWSTSRRMPGDDDAEAAAAEESS